MSAMTFEIPAVVNRRTMLTGAAAAAGKAIETHISNAAQRAGVYFPTSQA